MPYFLYLIHEEPIEFPYYCKVGYTKNPIKRLRELQAGNPRYLRSYDYHNRPTREFGLLLPSESHARALEAKVFEILESEGVVLRQDLNYVKTSCSSREWVTMSPDKLWLILAEAYHKYMVENNL